ncbi:MAG: hypothetical protein K2X62_09870 [Beijerinckiaceae bacterium]|nr:hypothetical protein [Beijerinckiaceae bacterium]
MLVHDRDGAHDSALSLAQHVSPILHRSGEKGGGRNDNGGGDQQLMKNDRRSRQGFSIRGCRTHRAIWRAVKQSE